MNNYMHLVVIIAQKMNASEVLSALDEVSMDSSGSESDPESWPTSSTSSSSSECSSDPSDDEDDEEEPDRWKEIKGNANTFYKVAISMQVIKISRVHT